MENNHQVTLNSARQIRTSEHYKFHNACQLPLFVTLHFGPKRRQNRAESLGLTVFSAQVATGQGRGSGESFVLR